MKRTPLKRKTAVKPVNPKRRGEAFLRAYGSEHRVAWIQAHPCIACGEIPSQNAHVRTGGTGRKADACWIVPLCDKHHKELHRKGVNTFEMTYHFALDIYAQIIDEHWQAHEQALRGEKPVAQALTLVRRIETALDEDNALADDGENDDDDA